MKKMICLAVLAASLFSGANGFAQSSAEESPEYVLRWCNDIGGMLRNALHVGTLSGTYEEEINILMRGIKDALNITSEKKQSFVKYTLTAAIQDLNTFPNDPSRQADHLRRSIREALEDLALLQSYYRDHRDNGPYVVEILERSLNEGMRVTQDDQEFNILYRGGSRGVSFLDRSDFRRSPHYACARASIGNSLSEAHDSNLSLPTKVQVLRSGLRQALGYLQGKLQCRWP